MKNFADKSIFLLVHEAGLVNNQYEFSKLCGRNPTWFSTVAARGIPMSITALGTLAANIILSAELEPDASRKPRLFALHAKLLDEIAVRCRAKAVATRSQPCPQPHRILPETF